MRWCKATRSALCDDAEEARSAMTMTLGQGELIKFGDRKVGRHLYFGYQDLAMLE